MESPRALFIGYTRQYLLIVFSIYLISLKLQNRLIREGVMTRMAIKRG